MSVILINTFEVPEELMDEHQKAWENHTKELLETKDSGLVAAKFHRAIGPHNKYQFVNVAEWESPEHFNRMINIEKHKKDTDPRIVFNPGLFEVVSEVKA